MKIRVVQVGLGPIGAAIAKQLLTRRAFQIVGVVDIDPQKIGQDLGDILGIGRKLRVKVTDSISRTIKATLRMELPEGFQTSEFLLEHGYIDRIVRRGDLKSEIARAIDYCGK